MKQFWKSGLWFIAVLCVAIILISYYASTKIDKINADYALQNAFEQSNQKYIDNLYANVTLSPDNAYSYYVKASKAMRKASDKLMMQDTSIRLSLDNKQTNQSSTEQKEAELKAYAPALQLIRQGFQFHYKKPQHTSELDFLNSYMLHVAQLFQRESKIELAKKNWATAANSAVDSIRLGEDITHGNFVDMLTGGTCEGLVLKNLQKTVNHVDQSTAQMLAKRLEKIIAQQARFADIIRAEKRQGLRYYAEFAESSDWRKQYPTTKSLKEMRKEYIATMDNWIADAKLPFPQRKTSIHIPNDPINCEVLSPWDNTYTKRLGIVQGLSLTIVHTRNALFMLEFALHAYYLKHGNYPAALNELVPDYLQKIPQDPFSKHDLLKYKSNKKSYVLYSIGPDGRDDGGKEINGDRIFIDKKGDILADSSDY